jgi:hypothetical protein
MMIFCSVNEVVASDLPSDVKSELKTLSHELAGAIVFDLGEWTREVPRWH